MKTMNEIYLKLDLSLMDASNVDKFFPLCSFEIQMFIANSLSIHFILIILFFVFLVAEKKMFCIVKILDTIGDISLFLVVSMTCFFLSLFYYNYSGFFHSFNLRPYECHVVMAKKNRWMDGNIFDIERIIFCLVCFSYLLLVLFLNCWLGRLF